VPEHRRGEVMGWSGTMSTVGNALGAPLCGAVIDRATPGAGFLTASVVGGGLAVGGLAVLAVARRRGAVDPRLDAPPVAVRHVPTTRRRVRLVRHRGAAATRRARVRRPSR